MNQLQNKVILKQMADNDKATILNNHSKVKIMFYACLRILLSLFLLQLNLFFKCSFWPIILPALKMCMLISGPGQPLAQGLLTVKSPLGACRLQPVVSEREGTLATDSWLISHSNHPHPLGHLMPLSSARQLASVLFNFPTSGFREKSWLWELALGSSWLPPDGWLARVTLSLTLLKEAV